MPSQLAHRFEVAGWICSEPGAACREPVCGDGFVDFIPQEGGGGSSGPGSGGSTSGGAGFGGAAGTNFGGSGGSSFGGAAGFGSTGFYEGCDDGATVPGDGCDSSCSVDAGWSCLAFNRSAAWRLRALAARLAPRIGTAADFVVRSCVLMGDE